MSDVPAGWYDDPENGTQYRYWDGSQWTEHRAPKTEASGGFDENNAGAVVTTGWNLFWRNWQAVLVIGLVGLAAFVVALVIAIFVINDSLDPSAVTVFERVTEPGFDPANDARDEAFIESIDFEPTPVFWVVIPLLTLFVFAVQGFTLGVAAIHLTASHLDRPFTIGESFRTAWGRLPRWIGVYLLWMLAYVAVTVAIVLLFVIGVLITPVLLVVLIPGALAFVIFVYPFVWLCSTPLLVGPTDEPPFRTTVARIRATGWGSVAAKVLLINLVVFGVSIGLSIIGLIPIIGFIISLIGNALVYAFAVAMNIPLWQAVGGRFGTDVGGPADNAVN